LATGGFSLGIPFRNLVYVDFILKVLLKKNTQMTREEFKETLEFYDYSYREEGSKTYSIILNSINSIPPDFVFSVPGDVWMDVDAIPQGVEFRNGGNVILASARRIHSSVRILNEGEFVIIRFYLHVCVLLMLPLLKNALVRNDRR
jgi:hypothetical protein